ncbi:hypothetical protein LDENG_00150550 [Lucifuga dentata]|nr:hypothetical protein LDENG_00150550 [Lucifuga dentata]
MSYRGRVLIINNLVSCGLWHKLACVDLPAALLKQLQSIIEDFFRVFWDFFCLHWVPQSKLFLPKEEGGQGLIHLSSRVATFRLQFVQRFLTGPADMVWRPVASSIFKRANGLGLDSTLFLMNLDCFYLCNLLVFHQNLYKTWTLFTWSSLDPTLSLHWLLEEPLVHGAWLDVQDLSVPGLTHALCSTANTTLRRIVDMAGPDLSDTEAVASVLGQRSAHLMDSDELSLWNQKTD